MNRVAYIVVSWCARNCDHDGLRESFLLYLQEALLRIYPRKKTTEQKFRRWIEDAWREASNRGGVWGSLPSYEAFQRATVPTNEGARLTTRDYRAIESSLVRSKESLIRLRPDEQDEIEHAWKKLVDLYRDTFGKTIMLAGSTFHANRFMA